MKIKALFILILGFFASFNIYAATQYTLDPTHTAVLWHINHFGFSNPSGKWMAEGTLTIDSAKPQNSQVKAIIHIDQITTGVAKLDEHLMSKDFFDAAQFPTAVFVSSKVIPHGKDKADVEGTLTLHGISRPVVLKVTLNKMGVNPVTQKETLGFTAVTELKRSDFDIKAYLPGLGDNVKINIEAEAYQAGSQ